MSLRKDSDFFATSRQGRGDIFLPYRQKESLADARPASNVHNAATAVGDTPYCRLNAAEKCDWFLKPTWT